MDQNTQRFRSCRDGREDVSVTKTLVVDDFFVNGHARFVRSAGPAHTMHRFRRYTLFAVVSIRV